MVAVRFRDVEGCADQPQLLWDTVWVQRLDAAGGWGDWVMAGDGDQAASRGGLRAEAALHTATLLQLFTDARARDDDVLPTDDGDRRGWWGDGLRLDDEPDAALGSRLWLLTRSVLTEDVRLRAYDYTVEALEVLRRQGAVARTDVTVQMVPAWRALLIGVVHWSRSGEQVYEQRFGVLWEQSQNGAQMNFGDRGMVIA